MSIVSTEDGRDPDGRRWRWNYDDSGERDKQYFYDPPRFCDCTKCGVCERNNTRGLCVYEVTVNENVTCYDCMADGC